MATPSTRTIRIASNLSVILGLAADHTRLKLEFVPITPRLQKDELGKLIKILIAYEAQMALVPI